MCRTGLPVTSAAARASRYSGCRHRRARPTTPLHANGLTLYLDGHEIAVQCLPIHVGVPHPSVVVSRNRTSATPSRARRLTQRGDDHCGTSLFHHHLRQPRLQRACLFRAGQNVRVSTRIQIIDGRFDQHEALGMGSLG